MKPVCDTLPTLLFFSLPFPTSSHLKLGSVAHLLTAESPLPPHQPTTLLRNLSSKTSYSHFSLCYCSPISTLHLATASPPSIIYPVTILPFFCSLSYLTSLFLGDTLKPYPADIRWEIKTTSPPLPSLSFSLHITILGFNTFMSTCSCVGSTAKFRLQSRQQHLPPTHMHLPS